MKEQNLPQGYSEERTRAIADYYENQTSAEAEAELSRAWADPSYSWVQVPKELLEEVQQFIARSVPDLQAGPSIVKESQAQYPANPGERD